MKWLALLALLSGCPTPTTGTIQLGLTAAPGSTLLDSVTHLRVTLTNPRQIVEADRTSSGFTIVLDVEANGEPGAIVVEGFDANGGLVAAGQSPEFGVAAIDARVVVYMSVPLAIDAAPMSLSPPRTNISSALSTFGPVFAGGRNTSDNMPSDAIAIYNVFDHTITGGKAMPAPRDGITVAGGTNGAIFLYGGLDAGNNPTGTYWLFDSRPSPSGAYIDLGDHPGLTRAAAIAIPVGVDKFVVTGAPPLDLQGQNVAARSDVASLNATGAAILKDATPIAITMDPAGNLVRFVNNTVDTLAASPHPGAGIAVLPDARFIVAGGTATDHDLLVIDGSTGIVSAKSTVLPHPTAIVAATHRHVLVFTDPFVELFDATTLDSIGMRDAPGATAAIALPNDQVLILGAGGALSLFTPGPPAL